MKKILALLMFVFLSTNLDAQVIQMKSMEVLTNDLTARTKVRLDNNGVECALIRVVIPAVKGMVFSGWVIGDTEYTPGEYIVYVPEGTKKIKFKHESYEPGEIVFTEPVVSKTVYRVILDVPQLTQYATECTAFVSEGGRLFGLRDYKNARQSYMSAIKSDDAPADMIRTIQSDIDICDSCITYENYALGALGKIRKMRTEANASQEEIVKYATAAIEFLTILNTYNPCEFYSGRIEKLSSFVADLPLEIRFTTIKWKKTVSGFEELGGLGNVEVWAYTGNTPLSSGDYASEKQFKKTIANNNNFSMLCVTDANGVADISLNRQEMPFSLIFRPVGYDKNTRITCMGMQNIMNESKGSYNKRQFRIRMFVNE